MTNVFVSSINYTVGNVSTPAKNPIIKIIITIHLGKANNLSLIISPARGFIITAVTKNRVPLAIPASENRRVKFL